MKLTPHERRQVSARTGVHDQTIRRWERGERVREASELRIRGALASLANESPPPSSPPAAA